MKNDTQLVETVKGYVATLEAIVIANREFDALVDGVENAGDYGDFCSEYDRLRWYFEDLLDVEFRVDAKFRYKSAVLTLACGGPGITLNTRTGEVKGYWGFSEPFSCYLRSAVAEVYDEYWEEQYNCLRGC